MSQQEFTLSVLDEDLLKIVTAFKPKITLDGNQWCCLYGKNLQEGIAGFGENPMNAVYNSWVALYTPIKKNQ